MIEEEIKKLEGEIGETVRRRIKEFEEVRKEKEERIFQELAFCILTANSSARMGLKAQREIGEGFVTYPEEKLREELKRIGYRFWRVRAGYIVGARWTISEIKKLFKMPEEEAREYLVKNVKGLGMKEASHFLRNTGAKNLAIVDRHIIRVLRDEGLIEEPKTLTRKKYLEIEEKEREISNRIGMNLAELDLYLWYMKTGEVLK